MSLPTAVMSSLKVDKLNEESIVVDHLPKRSQTETEIPDVSRKMSRKESLSGYFTIAAAAFGLIR